MKNLIINSEMNICSLLPLVRVGNPIPATTYESYPITGNGGAVKFTTPSGIGGLCAGKLFLVEGSGAPRSPVSGVAATVTGTPVPNALTNRMICAAGTFSGLVAGNWMRINGGSNSAPRLDYQIWGTDGSTYIDVFGGTSGNILPLGTATYDMTFYKGYSSVNPSVNGQVTNAPYFQASIGYPLEMTAAQGGNVYAALSGWHDNALGASAVNLWEVMVGDDGFQSPDACDGWRKTNSLKWHQIFKTDETGVSRVRDGSAMACRVIKGSASTEQLWINLAQKNPPDEKVGGGGDQLKIAQFAGKRITFGMEWWSPNANTARLFIFDGINTTYSAYFTSGSYDWKEVSVVASPNATTLRVGVEIVGAVGDKHYGTQPIALRNVTEIGRNNYIPFEGTIPLAQHTHFRRYVDSAPLPVDRKIRVLQESNGQIRSPKALMLDLEGRSRWTSALYLTDGSELSQPSCVLIENKANSCIMLSSGSQVLSDGQTKYLGVGNMSAIEADNLIPISFASTIRGIVITKSAGGAGTLYATLRVNGVDTGMSFLFSIVNVGSYLVAAPNIASLVSVNPTDKVSLRVSTGAQGSSLPTCTIQASLWITPSDHPLHVTTAGMQTVGRKGVSSPIPYHCDELFLRSQTAGGGWYSVTLDVLGAVV
jgi:hypothetical protein